MIQLYHMNYILAFDIPAEFSYFKLQINRRLKRIGAKMVQKALWSHSNLEELIKIGLQIKNIGGKARVMEEKLIFE